MGVCLHQEWSGLLLPHSRASPQQSLIILLACSALKLSSPLTHSTPWGMEMNMNLLKLLIWLTKAYLSIAIWVATVFPTWWMIALLLSLPYSHPSYKPICLIFFGKGAPNGVPPKLKTLTTCSPRLCLTHLLGLQTTLPWTSFQRLDQRMLPTIPCLDEPLYLALHNWASFV